MCLRNIHIDRIFLFVAINDDIAFVIVTFADQPTENVDRIGWIWIGDTAFLSLSVPSGNIIFGDGSPEGIRGIGFVGPALDAGK